MLPDMGDYAVYVWAAYGLALAVLVWSLLSALALRRQGRLLLQDARNSLGDNAGGKPAAAPRAGDMP